MPLDHVSIGTADARKAKAFYDAVLAPLGWTPIFPVEVNGHLVAIGYGDAGHPQFWVQNPIDRGRPGVANGAHVAFHSKTRAAVDEFYLAAIEAGGGDDGKPGLRTEYHPDYYAAFVRDPDGNKIEAVCHAKE